MSCQVFKLLQIRVQIIILESSCIEEPLVLVFLQDVNYCVAFFLLFRPFTAKLSDYSGVAVKSIFVIFVRLLSLAVNLLFDIVPAFYAKYQMNANIFKYWTYNWNLKRKEPLPFTVFNL